MIDGYWLAVRDGDARARALFLRHYSARVKPRPIGNGERFVGPGERMVLLTRCCQALFVWRWERFRSDDQEGVNCAVFRNEGAGLSSDLIREADELAWQRWPGERHFTFINAEKVRRKRDPGRCFLKAGWRVCGWSKEGLLILERMPA